MGRDGLYSLYALCEVYEYISLIGVEIPFMSLNTSK